ncbi:hypothetical protein AAG747_21055 [Rapidithrix thailandica]|uniref:Uncharacterized protein n=1 Tax=Rapidithrix thailandica TaxID=413964 RepID=A0AAW9SHX7_9BACT
MGVKGVKALKTLKVEVPRDEIFSGFRLKVGIANSSYENVSVAAKSVTGDATRINLANGQTRFTPLRPSTGQPVSEGWNHVVNGHFNRALGNNRSVFSISQTELRGILQSESVINSPLSAVEGGAVR